MGKVLGIGSQQVKKVLFIRSDRFGEFLLSLPAIKLIKSNYPKTKVCILAKKSNLELIKGIDFIDEFFEYNQDQFIGYRGAVKLSRLFRKEKFDCLVVLNPKKEFHLAALLAVVPLRVGYDRKWGFCLNRKIKDKKFEVDKHELEYNVDLTSLIAKDSFIPEVNLPVDQQDSLDFLKTDLDLSQRYIIMHPFSSNPLKNISMQFWSNLVNGLKEARLIPVLIGSTEEKPAAASLAKELAIINLVGALSLRNLATFMKHNCKAFIGLDSGPMHLASLLKIPVVGLFTVSNPKRWGPYKIRSLVLQGKSLADFTSQVGKIVNFIHG